MISNQQVCKDSPFYDAHSNNFNLKKLKSDSRRHLSGFNTYNKPVGNRVLPD